ncbi:MAG: hypothetical protein QHC67_15225 [Sphingobium sp.]|uniref:hypothetical protein n=1 Tax=Sphingobium sp. TaxID=1912891 RepID=UPI0029AFCF9A|nr:hypothetical protein [Sphingobium sp.]MDX3911150.1 hypothetical protein [Sphingobium sp.]
MTAEMLPLRLIVTSRPANAVLQAQIDDITGRYRFLAENLSELDARSLGLRIGRAAT